MSGFVHPPAFRYRSAWLLACGLLAIVLHMLAGSGLPRVAAGGGDGFEMVLCTSHGPVQLGSASIPGDGSVPATDVHDCCRLCAAGGPLLVAGSAVAVAPAPTFMLRQGALAPALPTPAVWTAHAPRGPPVPA